MLQQRPKTLGSDKNNVKDTNNYIERDNIKQSHGIIKKHVVNARTNNLHRKESNHEKVYKTEQKKTLIKNRGRLDGK